MTDLEKDALECNYPTLSDIIRLAQTFYPMSGQLHEYIESLCNLCGWNSEYVFKRIFEEKSDVL